MKLLFLILFFLVTLVSFGQNNDYTISNYQNEGTKAPNTHYIGEAFLAPLIHNDEELGYNITKATFKANSTLDWHRHHSVQVLIIVEGSAYYQERGKSAIVLNEGDIVRCPKNTEHWHSSTKNSDVTYLALYKSEKPTEWTEVVTQKYYDQIAQSSKSH